MSTLETWAQQWHVSPAAVHDLRVRFGEIAQAAPLPIEGTSEAAVQARTRLATSRLGWRVWRNNSGAGKLDSGNFVRFGLANDSEQLNKQLKSGDLIGARPRLIGPSDVGSTIGQFVSLECKPSAWRYTGTPREVAQLAWINLITALGGHARFVSSEGAID